MSAGSNSKPGIVVLELLYSSPDALRSKDTRAVLLNLAHAHQVINEGATIPSPRFGAGAAPSILVVESHQPL